MNKITCIIIEDNITDSTYLETFVKQYDFLDLRAIFSNCVEASSFIIQFTPQLLFMDIDMPGTNGMTFFRNLNYNPYCIFVTAHSEYALEGFEVAAFDYILKPVLPDRFRKAVSRLREEFEFHQRKDLYDSHIENANIIIREGSARHVVSFKEIVYIEAYRDFSKIFTSQQKKIVTLSKLKHFVEKLPDQVFKRVHRSYAVSLDKIRKLDGGFIELDGSDQKIPIGKSYRDALSLFL